MPDQSSQFEREPLCVIGMITGATSLGNYRWLYTWSECNVTAANAFVARSNGLTGSALSASEGSNGAPPTTYAFGVPSADLPATFTPKAIPIGTVVTLFARRRVDGSLVWIIPSAQAISGSCP